MRKSRVKFLDELVALEGEIFRDGYYKAFVVLAGPCHLCEECGKLKGTPCLFGALALSRPSHCGSCEALHRTAGAGGTELL